MIWPTRTFTFAAIGGTLALALSGCGSSSSTTVPSGLTIPAGVQTPSTQSLTCATRGGTLNVLNHEEYERPLDPGQSYFVQDYQLILATQRPLYAYKPNTLKEPSPDLAEGPPQISGDNKVVTIHIRHGVRFSPPVNREVTSSDVAYALERGANPSVANPYFSIYFSSIEGAEKAKGGPIPGIKTPNKYTIELHLTEPKAAIVSGALVLPLSAPVPEEYAKKYDAKTPSEYGSFQAATGPYMFQADSEHKVLGTGYQPGKSVTLVRNPSWNASTDNVPACLNQVNIKIGGEPNVIGRQVLQGSHLIQNDPPSRTVVQEAYEHYRSQLLISPGAGIRYVAVNNAHGPFANPNLRKALWAALDRVAMNKARGGELVSNVATHFIYPEINGFEEAGGLAGPKVDYNEHPEGNATVAEKYMKLAGYPSGKYTGSGTIQIVGSNDVPQAPEIVDQTLKNLGFKTKLTLVDQSTMYGKYCTVVKEEIDVCPSVGWVADFSDPQAFLGVAFNGKAISTSGPNPNFAQVNDPSINKAMEAAEPIVGRSARASAWANIDKELVGIAATVPYDWEKGPAVESKDVHGVGSLWQGGAWEYGYTSLK
jgi:peptide/nickel transport system substrate-binding protein